MSKNGKLFDQNGFENFAIERNILGFYKEAAKLKSGRRSPYYVDWRFTSDDYSMVETVTDYIISFTKDNGLNPRCFLGVSEGANTLACIASYKWAKSQPDGREVRRPIPMKRAKPRMDHGDPKNAEYIGNIGGVDTLILENTVSTGESALNDIRMAQLYGANVIGCIALTDRDEKNNEGGSMAQTMESKGIPYYAMSHAVSLIPKALKNTQHVYDPELKESIRSYFKSYGVSDKIKLSC